MLQGNHIAKQHLAVERRPGRTKVGAQLGPQSHQQRRPQRCRGVAHVQRLHRRQAVPQQARLQAQQGARAQPRHYHCQRRPLAFAGITCVEAPSLVTKKHGM